MGHKLAQVLSLIFVFQLLLMIGDVTAIQVIQANMQSLATTLVHEIALKGRMDETMEQRVESNGYTLRCLAMCQPQFGDTLTFEIQTTYDPLILSDQPLAISIIRYAVVGVYY
jgi:hypothetical protein